ncbi:hypothetical protein [Plantibacter sp. YIM 135249]|uniref:hypothetical protein n=1 Tax=Plantibacter sp. YIM 135249 TaxID=3423918 RepID=UPI003D35145C
MTASKSLAELTNLKWDAPYRLLASVLAFATIAGATAGEAPFAALAAGADWFHAQSISSWFSAVDEWAVSSLQDVPVRDALSIVLALCVAVSFLTSDIVVEARAAPTAWILAPFYAYGWSVDQIAFWIVVVAVCFLIAALNHRYNSGTMGGWAWLLGVFINLAVAAIWLPLTFLLWALVPDGKRTGPVG